jgi:hypothetical protein
MIKINHITERGAAKNVADVLLLSPERQDEIGTQLADLFEDIENTHENDEDYRMTDFLIEAFKRIEVNTLEEWTLTTFILGGFLTKKKASNSTLNKISALFDSIK